MDIASSTISRISWEIEFTRQYKYPQRGSSLCSHNGKNGHNKAKHFIEKPYKPKEIQSNEGLANMMKSVLDWSIWTDLITLPHR
jgi:hypothetical protein